MYFLLCIALLASMYPSLCNEIAYVLGQDGQRPIGQGNITEYRTTDTVSFTVSDSPRGPSTSYKAVRSLDSVFTEINQKIDRGNDLVRDEGLRLIGNRSGPQRIDQICSIYDQVVENWTFASDWRGLEQFQYSNYTLRKGMEFGTYGKGDCDDFSILLASLIEAVGGTPRIIFAHGQGGGHAYAEVYLGKRNDKDVSRMLAWLQQQYNAEINYHVDQESNDVWLNMDWWKDVGGANHPGGPFYQATEHIPIYIQGDQPKTPLSSIENQLPLAIFGYSPVIPEVGGVVTFNASGSRDPDGRIEDYEWDFGDGTIARGILQSKCPHIYSSSGTFPVNLTVIDNDGDSKTKTVYINVTETLPEAFFSFHPSEPRVDEVIVFDASQSRGITGQIIDYDWDFDDGSIGKRVSIKHRYIDGGNYRVNLTVTNSNGAKDTATRNVTVRSRDETEVAPALSSEEANTAASSAMAPAAQATEAPTQGTSATSRFRDVWEYPSTGEEQPQPLSSGSVGLAPSPMLKRVILPPGDTPVTIRSEAIRGYQVYLDGNYIGMEGTENDPSDGIFKFDVIGNRNHNVKAYDGNSWYDKDVYFAKGILKIIYLSS